MAALLRDHPRGQKLPADAILDIDCDGYPQLALTLYAPIMSID
jgi:hypothetical protein